MNVTGGRFTMGYYEVDENNPVSFTCHIDSYPPALVFIENTYTNTTIPTDSSYHSSALSRAHCLQSGDYVCIANNSIGKTKGNASIKLRVLCKSFKQLNRCFVM